MGKHSDSCGSGCNDSHSWQDHGSKDYWGGPQYSSEEDRRRYSGCFPASALVETPFGKITIGQLRKGDLVMSMKDGTLVERRITHKLMYAPKPLCQIVFESGATTVATASHSFLTPSGWRQLRSLKKGDVIEQVSATVKHGAHIREIVPSNIVEPVFNLYTEYEHNFIVDGCIVHNFTYLRGLRTILHNILFDDVPAAWADRLVKRGT